MVLTGGVRRSGAVLPWKIAFRVQFQSEKFGLRFHPAQFPDTGNGIYTIRLLELIKAGSWMLVCERDRRSDLHYGAHRRVARVRTGAAPRSTTTRRSMLAKSTCASCLAPQCSPHLSRARVSIALLSPLAREQRAASGAVPHAHQRPAPRRRAVRERDPEPAECAATRDAALRGRRSRRRHATRAARLARARPGVARRDLVEPRRVWGPVARRRRGVTPVAIQPSRRSDTERKRDVPAATVAALQDHPPGHDWRRQEQHPCGRCERRQRLRGASCVRELGCEV